jgi:hypothetical protein
MPLEFRADTVCFTQTCGAEDALELADWLLRTELPKADLGKCTHLHAALLQTLLAFKPTVSVGPEDPFLARWILPELAIGREPV